MKVKHWLRGLAIGIVVGMLVAAYFTVHDWQLNPGGIFHGEQGTNWSIVQETFLSWWLPVTGGSMVLAWLALFIISRFGDKLHITKRRLETAAIWITLLTSI